MVLIKSTLSIIYTVLLLSFLVSGCGASTKATSKVTQKQEPRALGFSVPCKSPRPKICTKEYVPVCASKDTGIRCVTTPCPSSKEVTYSNACTACSDPKVISYVPGGVCK